MLVSLIHSPFSKGSQMTATLSSSAVFDAREAEANLYMRTFARQPLTLVRGEGVRVWDDTGREYLDFLAGVAVNALGHCAPVIVEAVTRQVSTLIHTSNIYRTVPQLQLAKLLIDNSCMDRIFYANSGAEANECAIKLARKWGKLNRNGAFEVITALGSFHGRTLATLAATGNRHYQEAFDPMPEGFRHVPFNDLEAMTSAIGPNTAAIMLEVKRQGFALDNEEFLPGLLCVAVLVPSASGRSNLCVAVQAPIMRLGPQQASEMLAPLQRAAQALGRIEFDASPSDTRARA